MICTAQEEINQVKMNRPHVVILGAGASLACFPKGDKNGKCLPLMNNFAEVLNLNPILARSGVEFEGRNFEEVYDQIFKDKNLKPLRIEIEEAIYDYFSSLEIAESPTLYDYLLLSLRKKDVVATFNWDPFLVQAYKRNRQRFNLPRLQFLHGNVEIGYCEHDLVLGLKGTRCKDHGVPFTPSRLLYPISEKNYHLDKFISTQWRDLAQSIQSAFMLTVFGYGAPKSDVSAVDLLKAAWGNKDARNLEQTEIIDIKPEAELHDTWEPFIHSHHYDTYTNFFDSWIAKHPRRTGEAYLNQYIDAMFLEDNLAPRSESFDELWNWFDKLHLVEMKR